MSRRFAERSRRDFLRGRVRARPPYSSERRIREHCTGCAACIEACPESILLADADGFPRVDFRRGAVGCTFCGACVDACAEPVFDRDAAAPWRLDVAIAADRCFAHAGVHCEACRDACGEAAIRFRPRIGGPPTPAIDPERCTGCGACAAICPQDAVAVRPASSEATA